MADTIDSEEDLPEDIQDKVSSTFDLNRIKRLLTNTYYQGPIPEGEGGTGGHGLRKRGHALMGKPRTHRQSILGKATETNLITELSDGFASTSRGVELLQQMIYCDDCGEKEVPARLCGGSKRNAYISQTTVCPSCHEIEELDDGDNIVYGNIYHFERDDESLQRAVEAMQSNENVELWLNGLSLSEAEELVDG